MGVSTALQNGSSVIAWQSLNGVSFQLLDSNGVPIGGPITVTSGPSVWTSVSPLATGGFSVIWDGTANTAPTAQDYSASGAAVGAPYTLSVPPPTASMAFTSLELPTGDQNGTGPWNMLLPNGDTVLVTSGPNSQAPQLLMQQFDPSGHQVGSDYVEIFQGLPGLGRVQTTALAGGGYVVTATDNQNYGGALYYDLFRADGTHLAGQQVAVTGYQLMGQHATAALPDGGFVMSWVAAAYNAQPFTPAPFAIYAEEFRSDGSAATSAQRIATLPTTATNIAAPEIIALANGKYTISWTSGGSLQSASFTEQGSPVSNDTNDTIFTPALTYAMPDGPHNVTLVGSGAQTVTGNNLGDKIVSNEAASTLIGGQGNDTLVASHEANVMTGGGGADTFVFPDLPWNTGHITDFTSGTDKIDVSALLKHVGYGGADPFGDGTLTLSADGHGGTDLTYHPPGAGANGNWPVNIVDIDNVAPNAFNISSDFVTGYTSSGSGSGSGSGDGTGSSSGSGSSSSGSGAGTGSGSGAGGTTSSLTLIADNSPGQVLQATAPNAIFEAGQNSVVMTEDGGANTFVYTGLPWQTGQITNFNTASDKIDVSAILKMAGYAGSDPFGDGTLTLNADGHGGTDLIYNPPHVGTNGNWPISIVDIDNVAPGALNTSSDFTTGSSGSGPGSSATSGGSTGTSSAGSSGTGSSGTSGLTLTGNDTPGQQLTATAPGATFIAGQSSVVMTEDGGANTFVYAALPWRTGQITNFNPASDTIDVSGILTTAGYAGSDPLSDGTLSLNADGHGGVNLVYNPPGAGANGNWPIAIVDMNNVTASQLHAGNFLFHH